MPTQVYNVKSKTITKEFSQFYNNFKVLVTNELPLKSLQSIISDLSKKGMSFAISKQPKKGYCIWREVLKNEHPISGGLPVYGEIVITDNKILNSRNFIEIWDKGKLIFKTNNN